MAFDNAQVMQAKYQQLQIELAKANGEYESARLGDDADATLEAADEILDIGHRISQLERIAGDYQAAQQRGPQGNPHGLTDDEMDVASISHLTPEEYAKNKRKMEVMKGQGYWQHGSMKR